MIKKISIRIFSNIISTSDYHSNVSKKMVILRTMCKLKWREERVVRVGTWNIQVFEIQTERNLVFQTE